MAKNKNLKRKPTPLLKDKNPESVAHTKNVEESESDEEVLNSLCLVFILVNETK